MASLFYLVGPPAVGKLTVARCLEQRTGAIVVDNHLINDPVFVPMGVHRGEGIEATNELRGRVLDIVHEAIRLAPTRFSHVLTHWLPDKPENAELVERVRASAAARQARFVPCGSPLMSKPSRGGSPSRIDRSAPSWSMRKSCDSWQPCRTFHHRRTPW